MLALSEWDPSLWLMLAAGPLVALAALWKVAARRRDGLDSIHCPRLARRDRRRVRARLRRVVV